MPPSTRDTAPHVTLWAEGNQTMLQHKRELQQAIGNRDEGTTLAPGPDFYVPTGPFLETHRGRGMETAPWAVEQVVADRLNLEPIGKDPPRNIRMVKGMPMMCLIMGHQDAPPDEDVPVHARTLHPLHCATLKAYGYRMTIDHKKVPNGHQLFLLWRDTAMNVATGPAFGLSGSA